MTASVGIAGRTEPSEGTESMQNACSSSSVVNFI